MDNIPVIKKQSLTTIPEKQLFNTTLSVSPVAGGTPPPIQPVAGSGIEERERYVEEGICWLRAELLDLKKTDKSLMNTFQGLMKTMKILNNVNDSFIEQSSIMDTLQVQDPVTPPFVDMPLSVASPNLKKNRRALPPRSPQRYRRIGNLERHASFS